MQTPSSATARPQPIALIRVAWLSPVVLCLRRMGAPVERLLGEAHLSTSVFDHPEDLLPLSQVFRFMEHAARGTGVENLGLLAGRDASVDAVGMIGAMVRSARTVQQAFETVIQFHAAFSSGVHAELGQDGDRARLSYRFGDGIATPHRQADDYSLMLWLTVLRLAAGPRWRPNDILVERTSALEVDADIVPDVKLVGGRPELAISFPAALLRRPLVPTSATRRIDDRALDAWKASGPAGDFPRSVLQTIATLSSPDCPRISVAAEVIGTSVRALQRRLADVGMSYGGLVARARFSTAVHLLQRTDATVLDIALDLGYSDHAHFTRAFRRWTGIAPRDFRRATRDGRRTEADPEDCIRPEPARTGTGSPLRLARRR